MPLSNYIEETQDLLNDAGAQFFNRPTLIRYINRSRRRIAAASGCLRVVPPGTQTRPMQEIYNFRDWDPLVQETIPGVSGVLACRSLAIGLGGKWEQDDNGTWQIKGGSWKPLWKRVVWTDFQARFRIYGGTFIGSYSEPGWYSQYGEGPVGSIYLAPIPSQIMPMEVDLTCIPSPLVNDKDADPIPYPWTDAVCYWAAVMCLLQQQRLQDATALAQMFNADMPMCAAVVCPQFIATGYGAAMRSA
jgi:hypothetical protein